MTAGAIVTINGRPIASSWDGTDLVALAGLSIRWGREDPYEQPEPSILTMQLVDRLGNFVTDENRVGQAVVVAMADPYRVQFRGSLSKPRAERRRVHNPLTNLDETVWVVTFTASDVLANLGAAVFAGDAVDGWVEGAGGWSEARTNVRLQRLYDRGANGLVEGIDTLPQVLPANVDRIMHGQAAKDARTALELIQQVYRTHPMGVVNYDPHANRITVGEFTTTSPVALALSAGKVVLSLSAGLVVPASKVAVDSYTLESTVAEAIDVVQVGYFWYGKDPGLTAGAQKRTIYTEGFIEGRTARYDARSRRVLRVDTEDITFDPTEFTAGSVDAFNRFPAWLLGQVLAIVNGLNGQLRLPPLRFDARRLPLPAALEAVLYRPTVQNVPLHFAGSVYAGMAHVGPQFQIIGGILRYDGAGWSHEVNVCAARPNPAATLTVAQLVTNPGPTLADFDPDISLADLGLVTTGLA
ncbi:hypothetical protein SAMN04515691_2982 [Leifsonia sp. 98AMF]|uniref:hypothetical protein n=1 Tax=unclassified Leifsonia TaxID=2663824 RepID=UPI00087BCEA9|nr:MULTISPECIES: hypothetical protein [unclassified Leifsonia]SDH16226.1 hypothetical protein SAMN04515690_1034 [Leifsonia sp. 197AMF]SDJ22054.1 hypothetical protein SAMN04515684_2748 [Leifsonia sp. 466MF]SDK61710.1 hypothetical protein SAMN04515683_4016 [Leifsonia sp. 157MF]SDN43734.1 hypothetical protein SAMN04515686_0932 [Leifsonia sp. 509MF]SEN67374.1 hypothetical protein SAMN04515685_3997 [Leifsonia sp. 467MF]